MFSDWNQLKYAIIVGTIIRICAVYMGIFIDSLTDLQLQYTDIDYHVFSDAARYSTDFFLTVDCSLLLLLS